MAAGVVSFHTPIRLEGAVSIRNSTAAAVEVHGCVGLSSEERLWNGNVCLNPLV